MGLSDRDSGPISRAIAVKEIGISVISAINTDYIQLNSRTVFPPLPMHLGRSHFTGEDERPPHEGRELEKALNVLKDSGYGIKNENKDCEHERENQKRIMRKLSLDDILGNRTGESYENQYRYILRLIEEGRIKPVAASPRNGKKPSLYTMYWLVEEKEDYSEEREELLYHTDPLIKVDYYLRHPETYAKERRYVRRLNDFLKDRRDELGICISRNERSFAIWGEEKFLSGGAGHRVLGHCGIEEAFLNCHFTAEPFASYSAHRETPQKILIIENKDPFFGMRRHLLNGHRTILGASIGTLIYGAGKRVVSSFKEFSISAEPYMKAAENEFLYFGDLDYEGIGIYETLVQNMGDSLKIRPFIPAYSAMLKKAADISLLPLTKEKQNRNIRGVFFSWFDGETVNRMKEILESDRYLPQEILNITDY